MLKLLQALACFLVYTIDKDSTKYTPAVYTVDKPKGQPAPDPVHRAALVSTPRHGNHSTNTASSIATSGWV